MRFLVTGGAGFIGSQYVRDLSKGDLPGASSITVIDDLTYAGNLANIVDPLQVGNFRFVKGNICDHELMSQLISESDVIINFAAESHVDRSISDGRKFLESNLLGVHTILNCLLENPSKRFLQVSTDEVYGSIDSGSWNEQEPLRPNSPYSASKASADLLALAHFKTFGTNVSITRCSNNYGPFQFPEKFIPLAITNLLRGKKVPIYGDGLNIRDWLHVSDHCRAIHLACTEGLAGEVYNVGGGIELTNLQIVDTILAQMNYSRKETEFVEDRKGHDRRYSVDWSKIQKLGYNPQVTFTEGIATTIGWYTANEQWWDATVQQ